MKRFRPRVDAPVKASGYSRTFKPRERNTLPSDAYRPLVEKIAVPYSDEHGTPKEVHVTATLAGELGLPYVQILQYIDGAGYRGYAKGKTAAFPVEVLDDVIDALEGLRGELETANPFRDV